MTLCEQCGSINIEPRPPELTDRLVTIFTGRRPFVCLRCGWKARRNWTDDDLKALLDYGAGGAEPDPALVSLDEEKPRRKAQNKNRRNGRSKRRPVDDTFDLGAALLSAESDSPSVEPAIQPASASPRPRARRRKRAA